MNVVVQASEAWPVVAAGLGSAVIVAAATFGVASKQRQADSDRLDRQLAHDREMRDLQHLRETLAPIVARLVDWDAFLSLHETLRAAGDANHGQRGTIAQLSSDVGGASKQLRRDSRALEVLVGPGAPISLCLKAVAGDGEALIGLAWKWAEVGTMTPELETALPPLLAKYNDDHRLFTEAANAAVKWIGAPYQPAPELP